MQAQQCVEFGWSDISLPYNLVLHCRSLIKCYDALTFDLYWRHGSQQENKTEERRLIHSIFPNPLCAGVWFSFNHSVLTFDAVYNGVSVYFQRVGGIGTDDLQLATSHWLNSAACLLFIQSQSPYFPLG